MNNIYKTLRKSYRGSVINYPALTTGNGITSNDASTNGFSHTQGGSGNNNQSTSSINGKEKQTPRINLRQTIQKRSESMKKLENLKRKEAGDSEKDSEVDEEERGKAEEEKRKREEKEREEEREVYIIIRILKRITNTANKQLEEEEEKTEGIKIWDKFKENNLNSMEYLLKVCNSNKLFQKTPNNQIIINSINSMSRVLFQSNKVILIKNSNSPIDCQLILFNDFLYLIKLMKDNKNNQPLQRISIQHILLIEKYKKNTPNKGKKSLMQAHSHSSSSYEIQQQNKFQNTRKRSILHGNDQISTLIDFKNSTAKIKLLQTFLRMIFARKDFLYIKNKLNLKNNENLNNLIELEKRFTKKLEKFMEFFSIAKLTKNQILQEIFQQIQLILNNSIKFVEFMMNLVDLFRQQLINFHFLLNLFTYWNFNVSEFYFDYLKIYYSLIQNYNLISDKDRELISSIEQNKTLNLEFSFLQYLYTPIDQISIYDNVLSSFYSFFSDHILPSSLLRSSSFKSSFLLSFRKFFFSLFIPLIRSSL